MHLIAAVLISFATSIIAAGLFLPVYGIIVGGFDSCLTAPHGGWRECLTAIPISATIFGPLFAICGTVFGSPVVWLVLKARS